MRFWLKVAVSIIFIFSLFLVILYNLHLYEGEESRLKVWIDGKVFYDDEFNETYDYTQLWGKSIQFYEKLNSSEFASGATPESTEMVFKNLDEVCKFLRKLRVPNVVVGLVRIYGNGTYEEICLERARRLGLNVSVCPWDEFGTTLGDYENGVGYDVARRKPVGPEGGLIIRKTWQFPTKRQVIWELEVGTHYTSDNPPYEAVFTRYP